MVLPPETLLRQRYRLQRTLGHGGMGTVYQAVDDQTSRSVAVKLVLARDDQVRSAFEREVHILAQLDHSALPAVVDFFSVDTALFLVMSYVPGDDLAAQLAGRAVPFPHATVLDWADQLLDLLTYLHARHPRVIHRDIKPRNLKLSSEGRIVLLDFGLAKGLAGAEAVSLAGYSVAYAPPEQVRGEGTDPRSDLYALAATLYELLTRRLPFDSLKRITAIAGGQPDPLVPVHAVNPNVPPGVGAVIGQALALRAGARPATALAMQIALREAAGGQVTVLAPAVAEHGLHGPSQRPSGTVTFLATEIVAGEPVPTTHLARHDSLLQAAFDEHDGFVFRTGQAGMSVAFATADAALAAALDGQRALLAEPWGDANALKVRMALHAGAAELVGDDYVGAVLPRLTRLLAAGHGSQLLAAQAVRELLSGGLPAGVDLRDLGTHRLPDLGDPERVFQVVAADLPGNFPPLASRDVRSSRLPVAVSALIGRDHEVARICEQLRDRPAKLLTLTGPGGVGKTRLALAAAEALLDDFPDGVYFVPLAATRDRALAVGAVAQIIGVRETPDESLLDVLLANLRDRRVLLVLDNLEQVLDAGAFVADLLAAGLGPKLIVTSRTPMRVTDEHDFPVSPLAFPSLEPTPSLPEAMDFPAIELFVARARAVRRDFVLTPGNVTAVAGICARLDGLPLAIELAAARANLFEPEDLLIRLAERLPVLTARSIDQPARHQTLRATLAWSYALLAPAEQRLFEQLGVFVGGFDLEAAVDICTTPDDAGLSVVEGLAVLADQSLLRKFETATGESRYAMLETVREYAAERVAASPAELMLRQRHADYFMALAEAADAAIAGPSGAVWLARLESELGNLRCALAWLSEAGETERALQLSAALWRFWQVHGHLTEGRAWLDELLARSAGPAKVARARALIGAGALAWRQHDATAARHSLELAVDACRTLNEPAGLATALKHLGLIAMYETPPNYSLAVERFDESLALRRSLGDLDGAASCLNDLANVAFEQGDFHRAAQLFDETLALCRAQNNQYGLSFVLYNLSLVALELTDYKRAANLLRENLDLVEQLGSRERTASELWAVACVAAARGRALRAATLYGGAEALLEAIGAAFSAAELATLERGLDSARVALGPAEWATAVAGGRDRRLGDLLADALAELESG